MRVRARSHVADLAAGTAPMSTRTLLLWSALVAGLLVGGAFEFSRRTPVVDRVVYPDDARWHRPELEAPNYEITDEERPVTYRL